MDINAEFRETCLGLLQELGRCPAVSFAEGPVASCIEQNLKKLDVPFEQDLHGNFIAKLTGKGQAGNDVPPVAYVAHMDHPGFEAIEAHGGQIIARALGGVPPACFSDKVPVRVILPDGVGLKAETVGSYGTPDHKMVLIQLNVPHNLEFPRPVVFDLPDFHFDGELVHMRAADDLAGCASILAALQILSTTMDSEGHGDVYGVFTRAEEVGLIGARLLAEDRRLPIDTLVVSLEASRTLPGAVIGEGPVVRVGDAAFTFDAEAESVLVKAREELTAEDPGFKAQRQLMAGGTCEASAFRYHGYRTTGIAFPLGNYHNAGPAGEVVAEHIHIDDYLGGVKLIARAAQCVTRRHDSGPWRRMQLIPQDYRLRLDNTAHT